MVTNAVSTSAKMRARPGITSGLCVGFEFLTSLSAVILISPYAMFRTAFDAPKIGKGRADAIDREIREKIQPGNQNPPAVTRLRGCLAGDYPP